MSTQSNTLTAWATNWEGDDWFAIANVQGTRFAIVVHHGAEGVHAVAFCEYTDKDSVAWFVVTDEQAAALSLTPTIIAELNSQLAVASHRAGCVR